MSTRRGLVNNLCLGAGVGVNLYGAYFMLAFQGHLPRDYLPGNLMGREDIQGAPTFRRALGRGLAVMDRRWAWVAWMAGRRMRKTRRPRPRSADGGARDDPATQIARLTRNYNENSVLLMNEK